MVARLERVEMSARVGADQIEQWSLSPGDAPGSALEIAPGASWPLTLNPDVPPTDSTREIVIEGTMIWSHRFGDRQTSTFELNRSIDASPVEAP